ncbi:MAG: LacI family DNA-binding transcriptional regulator [Collinsella sp.]
MAKVKISDVAREAGVSLGTVSNALNHPEKLRPETLKLINETINRLGYLPNQSARQLAGGATKSFGLVLPRLDHGFSLQIASGAHNEARKHGYDLLIANADNDDILQDHYLRYFMGTQMSGVMVQPMASPDWHPAMTKMPVPIVHLDIHCSEPGYYVAADNEAQGRIIAELVIARGAHHITVVGRAAFMQLTLRVLGIHKALALHPDIKIEVIDAGEWNTAADGYSIGAQIAGRPADERSDFVVGLTDVLASGVISALVDKGIAVPGSTRSRLRWQPARLERIGPAHYGSAPGYEIGRKGVQLLMEQIENKAPAKTKHIRVGSTARTVTAVTAAEDINRQELVRPFLLERASTQASSQTDATAINLGAYL